MYSRKKNPLLNKVKTLRLKLYRSVDFCKASLNFQSDVLALINEESKCHSIVLLVAVRHGTFGNVCFAAPCNIGNDDGPLMKPTLEERQQRNIGDEPEYK